MINREGFWIAETKGYPLVFSSKAIFINLFTSAGIAWARVTKDSSRLELMHDL